MNGNLTWRKDVEEPDFPMTRLNLHTADAILVLALARVTQTFGNLHLSSICGYSVAQSVTNPQSALRSYTAHNLRNVDQE